jgi:hypothetical protein
VNRWLINAPRWLLGAVVGLPVAVVLILMTRAREDASWTAAIAHGLIVGVVVGAVMGPFLHRQNRRTRNALGDVPDSVRRTAGRAALWGPVPEDPPTRQAALRLAEHSLAQASRRPVLAWLGTALFIVVSAYLAVAQSPWWWLATAFWAALLLVSFVLRPRLRRRIELLQD